MVPAADVTITTASEFLRCPHCGSSDNYFKVSALGLEETSIVNTQMRGVGRAPIALDRLEGPFGMEVMTRVRGYSSVAAVWST